LYKIGYKGNDWGWTDLNHSGWAILPGQEKSEEIND